MRHHIAEVTLPRWLGFLEKRLAGRAYFVEDRLTIADLVIWRLLGWVNGGIIDGIPVGIVESYAGLEAHFQRIDTEPEVQRCMKRYVESS